MTGSSRIVRGRVLAPWAVAALAALLSGCDLGGRDRGVPSDGGADAAVDAGADAAVDAGADAGWQFEDAGDTWVDEPVEITGPCDNACAYAYTMQPRAETNAYATDRQYGRASFEVGPGGSPDVVEAREAGKFLMNFADIGSESSAGYRQRSIQSYVLDAESHDLVSGEILVYDTFAKSLYYAGAEGGGIERARLFGLSYDAAAGELTCAVTSGGRRWERTLEAPDPPLVLLNHRDYPIDTFGVHSPLAAMLLLERYERMGGSGVKRVPIFSPEMERLDAVEVERTGADTLVVRFPLDGAKPAAESEAGGAVDSNAIAIAYEHGIPASMESRFDYHWLPAYVPPVELNLPSPGDDPAAVPLPAGLSGGTSITATSGSVSLNGIVDAPAAAGPHAAVVMVPGWDYMTARGEVGAVDMYAQLAGIVVAGGGIAARFDARGAGDNGAAFSEATVDDLIGDAEAAVAAVQALEGVDPDRVFLLTTGAGAHVAAGVAAGGAVPLAGIVLIAPVGSAYVDAAALIDARYVASSNPWHSYPDVAAEISEDLWASLEDGTYAGEVYRGHTVAAWQSLFALDLVSSPVDLPPTLLLYGTEDHLIPRELVEALAAALAAAADGGVALADGGVVMDVTTGILPGLTHALTPGTALGLWPEHGGAEAIDDTAAAAITSWLAAIAGGL